MKKKVCVVGAGIGGLTCAVRLAQLDFDVDLYEKNSNIGGKVNQLEENGFRFDTGASLVTMPFVFDKLFEDIGVSIREHLTFEKLDILCKYFFNDGSVINAYSDIQRFAEEIENKTADTKESVKRYLNYCRRIYELSGELFLNKSFTEPSTLLSKNAIKTLFQINGMDINRTMHAANESYFKDQRTIQIFDRYATYNGSTPFKAPATLNVIQHVEYNIGGYICHGGVYEIPKALYKIAVKKGVNIYLGKEIKRINHFNRKINGVNIEGRDIDYDVVISNADVQYTYENLLNDKSSKMAKRYSRLEKSSSAIVFYWGINGEFEKLETHNILFSKNYKQEFEELFEQQVIAKDPTVYIYISSKFNASDAPDGCENWFVLVNVPPDDNNNWNELTASVRERTIKKISNFLNIDITKHILFERVLSPDIIEKKYNSLGGSIYGISSNNKMAAFLRQQNRSKYYKGLYFSSGSAHPGGGVPLVTLSGKITSELIHKYETGND